MTIICGFPGIGKSHYCGLHPGEASDSDSSLFSWSSPGVRHPDFPGNYVSHILEAARSHRYVFVSSHKAVRDALLGLGILFYVVYPDKSCKGLFMERYARRGSDAKFLSLMDSNFESWVDELDACERGATPVYIKSSSIEEALFSIQGGELCR